MLSLALRESDLWFQYEQNSGGERAAVELQRRERVLRAGLDRLSLRHGGDSEETK